MKRLILLITVLLGTINILAQTSKVNVTIDGPGVVDEYLSLGTDGMKQLRLKAVPSKFLGNVTFDGWSGDATGTSEELTVDADKAQNIHATFTYHRPTKQYPLVNLKQSWAQMGKPMYYEMPGLTESEAVGQGVWRGHSYLPVDYNRDGYLDYIQFPMRGAMGTDNHRENVRFWLGKPDGSFEEDPLNDNRIVGTVLSIHVKYADLNDDGYPDFISTSSGYDREGSTYDYPVILMSGPDGVYTDLRFPDYVAYFHGGEVGDIDNDGDIDVVFISIYGANYNDCLLLINDGKGNFTEKNFAEILDVGELNKRFSTPGHGVCHGDLNIIDLNNDGYNDLAFTGSDVWDDDGSNYHCAPMVLWGNSSGIFGGTNYSLLPKCRLGYSICEDLIFYDINGDGVKEIIAERNGDGQLGGTRFYMKGYLQVCELENGQYVDKTEEYIPVENTAYNETKSETCLWIENIDGTDYVISSALPGFYAGLGMSGIFKIYAIRNGILEPVEGYTQTKVPSYDEGMPIFVDGPLLTDLRFCGDGVNPVDTMAEHSWSGISDWDAISGNMWRINPAHRKDTHYGRTCIRWNRDGQDPSKEYEGQNVIWGFVSDIDIQKLADEGYYLEFYIKNNDPELTLNIGFSTYDVGVEDSDRGLYVEMSKRHVEGGSFNGEWQRVLIPLSAFNGNGSFSKYRDFSISAGKGDLNNEFYLDDIRIRRLADSGIDDYNRAFLMDYLNNSFYQKERTAQVKSREFKTMLKPLIEKFALDSMSYFNSNITDYEVPLTRGMATCMAYYTARCIGAETNNSAFGDLPTDLWDGDFMFYDDLLPLLGDLGEDNAPEDMPWRSTGYGGFQTCWWWNVSHQSDHSGLNVIALDKEMNSYHWNDPLTREDAISAITRLYDSLDPEKVASPIITLKLSKTKATIEKDKTLTLKVTLTPSDLSDKSVTWKSSNTSVATVSTAGKVKGVKAGTATITCTSKATGLKETCAVTVGYVKLDKTTANIEKGKTLTLKATVYPSSLKDKSVTWTTSDKKIATVSSSGKVTGVKAGTATITCTSKATNLKATCKVTVGYVKLDKTTANIEKGKTLTLKATVYPSDLKDKSVTWTTSDKKIATVSSSGKVTGVKAGTATITCTSKATGLKETCKVTIGYVKLNETTANIEKGKTLTLKATVYPSDLKDKSVTWTTSDKKIATVSSSGKVTGVKAGTATITCTSKATNLKATCKVTIGYVKLDKTEVRIKKGKTVTLKATVYPSLLKDKSVTWKSSNTKVATVTSAGKVKGIKAGTATITCTSKATGLKETCKVTVSAVAGTRSMFHEDENEDEYDGTTGIEDLEERSAVEEGPYDVYDLSGRKVANQVTSLDGLPHGIYIVNGKKMLKR